MFIVAIVIFAATVPGCASSTPIIEPDDETLVALAWLSGAWVSVDDSGSRTEEHWTTPSAGTMLGVNRTIVEGRTVFFEFLRIEATPDGQIVYFASPEGRDPPTPFTLIEQTPERFVFENLDHDFPQRIIYTIDEDGVLTQRIEGVQNGEPKSSEWTLQRATLKVTLSLPEIRHRVYDWRWKRSISEDSYGFRYGRGGC
jgi:hypothetical protein